jgi:4'-phosphopantetheinyl transferase
MVREVLGGYLNCPPESVPLVFEATGKPLIDGNPLQFNLSHSERIAALAVSRVGRVGIDLEKRRAMDNAASLVERFFNPIEHAAYQALPEEQKDDAFFCMWTRKEAILKAIGQGIHALDLCEISVDPTAPACLHRLPETDGPLNNWHLHDWHPHPDYHACLAFEVAG